MLLSITAQITIKEKVFSSPLESYGTTWWLGLRTTILQHTYVTDYCQERELDKSFPKNHPKGMLQPAFEKKRSIKEESAMTAAVHWKRGEITNLLNLIMASSAMGFKMEVFRVLISHGPQSGSIWSLCPIYAWKQMQMNWNSAYDLLTCAWVSLV